MTRSEVIENMKKDLQGRSDAELKHMLEAYDSIVEKKTEEFMRAVDSLQKSKLERKIILIEIRKREKPDE